MNYLVPNQFLLIAFTVAAWLVYLTHETPAIRRGADVAVVAITALAYVCAGCALATHEREAVIDSPLRAVLDAEFGGFALSKVAAAGSHDVIHLRARLLEDAAVRPEFASLRARVEQLRVRGSWVSVRGDAILTVGGRQARGRAGAWRAGRRIQAFATFRRPSVYLNEGVPDFERRLALDGTTLFGSIKSGLLVNATPGTPMDETTAAIRGHVRRSIGRWVGEYDPVAAAVVTAVLIGDRSALPDDVQDRLQRAGTYHVIAISGGNIAILAGLILALLVVCGISGRPAALLAAGVLLVYAQVVTAGPSVWRATTMALVYLGARALDHRAPPWQAIALSALLIVVVRPLDVRDAGFLLTFGATVALVEAARRSAAIDVRHQMWRWAIASVAASAAAELALLPVSATIFSRVTAAGLLLNLAAVPLMAAVQVSGMAVALFDSLEVVAAPVGWIAYWSTTGLLTSARLVDVAPWLTVRVPPPHAALVAIYYGALAASLLLRQRRAVFASAVVVASACAIVTGYPESWIRRAAYTPAFRIIAFDVGQGDATLLEFPDRTRLLVDAGGAPFGGGSFDVGERVLAPALWSRGIRHLDTLVVTHGDPDHIGGAPSVVRDFGPQAVWQGVPVPAHRGLAALVERAGATGAVVEDRRQGDVRRYGGVEVRVLHPPVPDWDRPRVRNDDSVVLDVRYRDVSVLLMGDVSASIERSLVSRLRPARIRILKAGHHGSRTSTSQELLDAWRPQVAIISCGRGNTFGHPGPEVLRRLEATGAAIYRTDLHGQISIESGGTSLDVRTFTGGKP